MANQQYNEMIKDLKESGNYEREPYLQEVIDKKYSKVGKSISKSKVLKKKMSYKSGSPLKKLLNKKKGIVYVKSSGGESVNLMKAQW